MDYCAVRCSAVDIITADSWQPIDKMQLEIMRTVSGWNACVDDDV